jgi:hypothetical protein
MTLYHSATTSKLGKFYELFLIIARYNVIHYYYTVQDHQIQDVTIETGKYQTKHDRNVNNQWRYLQNREIQHTK